MVADVPRQLQALAGVIRARIQAEYDKATAVGATWRLLKPLSQLAKLEGVALNDIKVCWSWLIADDGTVELPEFRRVRRLARLQSGLDKLMPVADPAPTAFPLAMQLPVTTLTSAPSTAIQQFSMPAAPPPAPPLLPPPPLPPPLPLLPPPPVKQDWSSFQLTIDEGALPATELAWTEFRFHLAQQLAGRLRICDLLSEHVWADLRTELDLRVEDCGVLDDLWRPVQTVLRVSTEALAGIRPEAVERARLVAAVFLSHVDALFDAELLCTYLLATRQGRRNGAKRLAHASASDDTPPDLRPATGGSFVLIEVGGDPMRLRLVLTHCALLGLQCKSGCIGPQAASRQAASKRKLGAQLPAFRQLPALICTAKGRAQHICNEAALIRAATNVLTSATRNCFGGSPSEDGQVPLEEWSTWDVQVCMAYLKQHGFWDGTYEASALLCCLFLAKYNRLSPTFNTRFAAVYAVHHDRPGPLPWWLERAAAHLQLYPAYFDALMFGSLEHDGIKPLQAALGFDVDSGAGIAMELVAFNAGKPRSAAAVLNRHVRNLPRNCRLITDCSQDWYETLLAMAAGWIAPCTSAQVLQQVWLGGVFPTDRVAVLQVARPVSGYQKKKADEEHSGQWQYCIISALLAQLVSFEARQAPLELERMASLPKDRSMAALECKCSGEAWWRQDMAEWARGPCAHRPTCNNGGHQADKLEENAQAPLHITQTPSAAKAAVEAITFRGLWSGAVAPIDLLSAAQVALHDVVHLKEHVDAVGLYRLALFVNRGELRTYVPNVTFPFEPLLRQWDKCERLRVWQQAHGADPLRVKARSVSADVAVSATVTETAGAIVTETASASEDGWIVPDGEVDSPEAAKEGASASEDSESSSDDSSECSVAVYAIGDKVEAQWNAANLRHKAWWDGSQSWVPGVITGVTRDGRNRVYDITYDDSDFPPDTSVDAQYIQPGSTDPYSISQEAAALASALPGSSSISQEAASASAAAASSMECCICLEAVEHEQTYTIQECTHTCCLQCLHTMLATCSAGKVREQHLIDLDDRAPSAACPLCRKPLSAREQRAIMKAAYHL